MLMLILLKEYIIINLPVFIHKSQSFMVIMAFGQVIIIIITTSAVIIITVHDLKTFLVAIGQLA